MTTTLGQRGQVVIPAEIRNKHHLRVGDDFVVNAEGNKIILEKIQPTRYRAKLVRQKGKLPVFVLPKDAPPMDPARIKEEADKIFE